MKKVLPTLLYEKEYWQKGYTVIGIDEVGRGAFAGPLVLAGVIFDQTKMKNSTCKIEEIGIDDSKKLSASAREELSAIITKEAFACAIVSVSVQTINKIGIGKATFSGARSLVKKLQKKLQQRKLFVLMDAFYIPHLRGVGVKNQKAIIHGDEVSLSIAAASIIAKVYRDSYMKKLSEKYPAYGFERHVGYGTEQHRNAIKTHGLTRLHRLSFCISCLSSRAGFLL